MSLVDSQEEGTVAESAIQSRFQRVTPSLAQDPLDAPYRDLAQAIPKPARRRETIDERTLGLDLGRREIDYADLTVARLGLDPREQCSLAVSARPEENQHAPGAGARAQPIQAIPDKLLLAFAAGQVRRRSPIPGSKGTYWGVLAGTMSDVSSPHSN